MYKRLIQKIPSHIKLIFNLYAFGIILFCIYRIIFYSYNSPIVTQNNSFNLIIKSFLSGLRFDVVMLSYSLALPFILLSISNYAKNKITFFNTFCKLFITLVLGIYQFIWAVDIPYYHQFGNHLHKQALLWKDETLFMVGFIFQNFSYWGFLVLYIFILLISFYSLKLIFKRYYHSINTNYYQKTPVQVIQCIVLAGFIFLGIRGTLSQKTTLHEGFAIISSNAFINNVGLNPNFTFLKSLSKSSKKNAYVEPKNINEQLAYTRNYLGINTPFEPNINREIKANDTIKKYNIVVVIMESMSIAKMGYYGYPNLTPNLHALNKESVFCNAFFSSGIHTFNGLFSTTTGYPGIYDEQALKRYTKQKFDGLGSLLKTQGYTTYFGTTHDAQFDNMEGFFRINEFDNVISQGTMPSSKVISTLGVPDHVLLNEFIDQINSKKSSQPFLGVLMTATDHGPWIIPTDIAFKPSGKNEQENCTQYADWAIGNFITNAKKQPWYNNTVFIFLGDHGFYLNQTYEMPISYNHIPCIIHQPKLFKADTISSPCYQPDIPATVMGIIGAGYTNKTFGINILKETHPFVVFSADDKIGYVDGNGFYYYKTLSDYQTYLRKYKDLDPTNYNDKYKQKIDSIDKNMMQIYESAHYLLQKNYYIPE